MFLILQENRVRQPPEEGIMVDLLWSDPQVRNYRRGPKILNRRQILFILNFQELPGRSPSTRGVGIQFGPDVTEKFLKLNNLELVIRLR